MSRFPIRSFSKSWATELAAIAALLWCAGTRAAEPLPALTRVTGPCTDAEQWVFGRALRQSVPETALNDLVSGTLTGKEPAVRAFADGAPLTASKDSLAAAFGDYWAARALFRVKQYASAIPRFSRIVERKPTAELVPVQMAVVACLLAIHDVYPVVVFPERSAENLPNYFKPGLVPAESRSYLWEAGIHLVMRALKGNKPKAAVEKAIGLLKGSGPYEDYARAVWAIERNKPAEATRELARLAYAEKLPPSIRSRQNQLRNIAEATAKADAKAAAEAEADVKKTAANRAGQAEEAAVKAAAKATATVKQNEASAEASARKAKEAADGVARAEAEAQSLAATAAREREKAQAASTETAARKAAEKAEAGAKKAAELELALKRTANEKRAASAAASETARALAQAAAETAKETSLIVAEAQILGKKAVQADGVAKQAGEKARTAASQAAKAKQLAARAAAAETQARQAVERARTQAAKADEAVTAGKAKTAAAQAAAQQAATAEAEARKAAADALAAAKQAAQSAKAGAKAAADARGALKKAEEAETRAFQAATAARETAKRAAARAQTSAQRAVALAKPDSEESRKAAGIRFSRKALGKDPLPAEVARLADAIEAAEGRQERLTEALPVWVKVLNRFKAGAQGQREKWMERIERMFHDLNERMMRQLVDVIENNELIEAEIWNGTSQDIVWQNAHPEYEKALKSGKFAVRKPAGSAAEVYDWGTSRGFDGEGEIWEDELGAVMANLNDNCSNKERYMKLQRRN